MLCISIYSENICGGGCLVRTDLKVGVWGRNLKKGMGVREVVRTLGQQTLVY